METRFYVIDAESERIRAMAADPAGFSVYRKNKLLKLKNERSRLLSAAATAAIGAGLGSFGLHECETPYFEGEYGKPYIAGHPEIVFNVSHSGRYAVAVFLEGDDAARYDVGVDIERISRMNERIISYMAADEGFEGSSDEERMRDACRRWTAREAFVKCTGLGITAIRDDYHFEKLPDGQMRLCQNISDHEFEIREAEAPEGYCITCVLRKKGDIKE